MCVCVYAYVHTYIHNIHIHKLSIHKNLHTLCIVCLCPHRRLFRSERLEPKQRFRPGGGCGGFRQAIYLSIQTHKPTCIMYCGFNSYPSQPKQIIYVFSHSHRRLIGGQRLESRQRFGPSGSSGGFGGGGGGGARSLWGRGQIGGGYTRKHKIGNVSPRCHAAIE